MSLLGDVRDILGELRGINSHLLEIQKHVGPTNRWLGDDGELAEKIADKAAEIRRDVPGVVEALTNEPITDGPKHRQGELVQFWHKRDGWTEAVIDSVAGYLRDGSASAYHVHTSSSPFSLVTVPTSQRIQALGWRENQPVWVQREAMAEAEHGWVRSVGMLHGRQVELTVGFESGRDLTLAFSQRCRVFPRHEAGRPAPWVREGLDRETVASDLDRFFRVHSGVLADELPEEERGRLIKGLTDLVHHYVERSKP